MNYTLLLSLFFALLTLQPAFAQTTENPPNILWITCEDLNAYLGSYGNAQAITPNLDRLATEGVRFTQAFATAPVCSSGPLSTYHRFLRYLYGNPAPAFRSRNSR